jgi:LysM repeat protein
VALDLAAFPVATSPAPSGRPPYGYLPGFGQRRARAGGVIVAHQGVDIIAATGQPVVAVWDGRVTARYTGQLGGNSVRLTRTDGSYALYLHLNEFAVELGQPVRAGDVLGTVGSTGASAGPHLHFELHPLGGAAVDPYPWLVAADPLRPKPVPAPGSSRPSAPADASTYTVRDGDSLWGIATRHEITLQRLLDLNKLRVDSVIWAGQVLRVKPAPGPAPGNAPAGGSAPSAPPAAPPARPPSPPSPSTYTVQRGDNLWRIAVEHGLTLGRLTELNGITASSVILPGQVLVVKAAPPAPSVPSPVPPSTYVVVAGDSLWGIASRHGLTVSALAALNKLGLESVIVPGQRLRVA